MVKYARYWTESAGSPKWTTKNYQTLDLTVNIRIFLNNNHRQIFHYILDFYGRDYSFQYLESQRNNK